MRQVQVQVRSERAERVLQVGADHDAFSPLSVGGEREGGEAWSIVFLHLPNDRVGEFIWALREQVGDAQFVILPFGVLPVQTPMDQVHPQIRDVAARSTLELVLGALQSTGSWKAILLYACFSGIVAGFGLIVGTSYMLVAAMLIAPFGAPLMVATVGATVGDRRMVLHGAWRFAAAVGVMVLSAAVMGWVHGLDAATATMEQVSSLSLWTTPVALVAGAAGAQSQIQSERASLVTATATGFLVAAALAPVSALLGLAVPMARWDYVQLMGFQLVLQFFALVTGGWMMLRFYGVKPGDATTERGSRGLRTALAVLTVVGTLALTGWQVLGPARLRKVNVQSVALDLASDRARDVPGVRLVQATVETTASNPGYPPGEGLLVEMTVQRASAAVSAESAETAVRRAVSRAVRERFQGVTPFVAVTVLPPGEGG